MTVSVTVQMSTAGAATPVVDITCAPDELEQVMGATIRCLRDDLTARTDDNRAGRDLRAV